MRADAGAGAVATKEELIEAAGTLHAFLSKQSSALCGLIEIIAQGGVFWAGHVATKIAKASIAHKPIHKRLVIASLCERARAGDAEPSESARSEASALMD